MTILVSDMSKKQSFTFNPGDDLSRFVAFLSAVKKPVEVTIKEVTKERSDPQNSALYGVAYKALGEFTGYTDPELHDAFLRAYFGEVEKEVMGKLITKPRRTTTTDEDGKRSLLSTVEFNAFYAFIQQKGAEIGCWVPDPDPRWRQNREDPGVLAA